MTVTLSARTGGYSRGLEASTAATGVPTLYATYVRTKGKRTYERVALTANYSEALAAHRQSGPGGDALEILVDAGGNPPMSFPSKDRDDFKRRYEQLRADSRLTEAAAIIDQIPLGESVACGLDDGLAFALKRIWDERRSAEGRAYLMYAFELFAGKPRTWELNTSKHYR